MKNALKIENAKKLSLGDGKGILEIVNTQDSMNLELNSELQNVI